MDDPYLSRISASVRDDADYALEIPAIRSLLDAPLELDPRVSFFVGEKGSGKSTLVEAIAVASKLPILLGYPHAAIFEFGDSGLTQVAYEDTEPYRLTKGFLDDPDVFLRHLLDGA